MIKLHGLFSQDERWQASQHSDIQKEIDRIRYIFRGKYRDENIGWRVILDVWNGIGSLNPKIILALIDGLAKHIEEVVSVRADVVRYIKEHRDEIGEEIVDRYLEEAKKSDGECRMNLMQLEAIKQDILQSNETTLVDANKSIQQASQPYKEDDRFEVQLQLASDIPHIHGNAVKVSYVWTNLFRNAVDAVSDIGKTDKSRKGRLIVKTQAIVIDNKGFVEVTVSDNGIGIPETLLQSGRLFQKGVTTKRNGNGLGLYLIKQTVEELGGTIDVRSEVGKGTTFTIHLPITHSQSVAEGASPAASQGSPLKRVDPGSDVALQQSELTPEAEEVSGQDERIHTTNLQDTLTYIEAQPQTQPIIVALGTSWIKGYEKGRYLQYDALNPLMSNIGNHPQFIVGDDKNLLAEIKKKMGEKGFENARVIVLAGEETVTNGFAELDNGKNVLMGVDNKYLTVDSYVRLMEMLEVAARFAIDPDTPPNSPNIPIEKRGNFWIFMPRAEPMDYEKLKTIYEVQKFA